MTIEVPPASTSCRELLEAPPVAAVLLAPVDGDLRVEYANPAARGEAGIVLPARIRATRARAVVVDLTGVPPSSPPWPPRSCTPSSPPA